MFWVPHNTISLVTTKFHFRKKKSIVSPVIFALPGICHAIMTKTWPKILGWKSVIIFSPCGEKICLALSRGQFILDFDQRFSAVVVKSDGNRGNIDRKVFDMWIDLTENSRGQTLTCVSNFMFLKFRLSLRPITWIQLSELFLTMSEWRRLLFWWWVRATHHVKFNIFTKFRIIINMDTFVIMESIDFNTHYKYVSHSTINN